MIKHLVASYGRRLGFKAPFTMRLAQTSPAELVRLLNGLGI